MDRLWAPWRINYILDGANMEGKNECIFCIYPAEGQDMDESSLIIYRSRLSFIIMNRYPYNTGHIMVAPYRHVANFDELFPEELEDITMNIQLGIKAVKRRLTPSGFNIGINQGKIAGAGIKDHIHIHIVPRWDGDTNFMPVINDTKVLPESISDTYKKIRAGMDEVI